MNMHFDAATDEIPVQQPAVCGTSQPLIMGLVKSSKSAQCTIMSNNVYLQILVFNTWNHQPLLFFIPIGLFLSHPRRSLTYSHIRTQN